MGRMGLDSLESHRLKRPPSLDFANIRQYHAIYQVKHFNSLLGSLAKDSDRLVLLGLRMSQKVPQTRTCWMCGRLDSQIRCLMAIAKGFPHPKNTNTCWGWGFNMFLSCSSLKAQLIRKLCFPKVGELVPQHVSSQVSESVICGGLSYVLTFVIVNITKGTEGNFELLKEFKSIKFYALESTSFHKFSSAFHYCYCKNVWQNHLFLRRH